MNFGSNDNFTKASFLRDKCMTNASQQLDKPTFFKNHPTEEIMDNFILDKQGCLVYFINHTNMEDLDMESARPDFIKLLEEEKIHCQEQLKRINLALKVFKGETSEKGSGQPIKRTVPWKAKIKKLFQQYDKLTTENIIEKLAESGIAEVLEDKGKNAVYSTLSRMAKDGILDKLENGKYARKMQRISSPDKNEGKPLDHHYGD